jgi:tetratricopeptide (TPR) repeat protein
MRQGHFHRFTALIVFALVPSCLYADKQADDLNTKSKAAMKQKDIEHAVEYLCDAAKLDPGKYSKKCDSIRQQATSQLTEFEGLFGTGKFEFEKKDYAGAIRDLSKISFGPHREDAQRIIQEANGLLKNPSQPADTSMQSLRAAQAAYESGDFASATAAANQVKATNLQPIAQQILTNIRVYNETIEQGDASMQSGNYAAAQQKYNFALGIKNNGPGNPADKLKQISALLAPAEKPAQPVVADKSASRPAANKSKSVGQAPPDNSLKIKNSLAEAHSDEDKGDLQAALAVYEQVLSLDPQQADAVTGKQRVSDAIRKDPRALEDTLINGIRSYYQSHLTEARDALSLYLTSGGTRSKGAAYFYLGATFMTQAFLSDPKNKAHHDSLQQSAVQEFQLAKQEHFKPVEKYVSPKILAVWNQSGS